MKKIFLFTLIVAGTATSFGQTNTKAQSIANGRPQTYKEAQATKMKQQAPVQHTNAKTATPASKATAPRPASK